MKIMGLKPVDFPSNQSIDPWSFRSMFLPDVPHGTKALTWKDEPLQAVLSWPYHGLLCIPMDDDQVSCTHLWFTYRHMLIHTWVTVNSIPFHFHSLPLHTSITLHYIYIYVYIYTYRERVGYIWYYVIMQYMAFLSLMIIMYKTCISFFSIRAMAPPRRSNVSTPRSGRFAALRSGTTSALSSTWRHPTWRHDNMHLSLW